MWGVRRVTQTKKAKGREAGVGEERQEPAKDDIVGHYSRKARIRFSHS